MKTFTTKTTVQIAEGQLVLSSSQAAARSHALEPLGDGIYRIIAAVEFKAGETFGHDLPIPKTIAACLDEADELPALKDLDIVALRARADLLGLNLPANMGKAKVIKAIEDRQDQLLAELEALPDPTDEQKAELESLKA